MGRYTAYLKDIWELKASRKIIGIGLFGVIVDNCKPFTPGDPVVPLEGVEQAIQMLTQKGYDLMLITGQPPNRTRPLEMHDFDNILNGAREYITKVGGQIRNAYYAPGTDKNDPYVKPNTGMFDRAQNENNFKWSNCYFVGSEVNDVKVANKVKATPILIKAHNSETKLKAFELTHQIKVKEFTSLLEFAQSLE